MISTAFCHPKADCHASPPHGTTALIPQLSGAASSTTHLVTLLPNHQI